MATFFSKFRNNRIPVINWSFFASLKEAKKVYNSSHWSGWNKDWLPIASTEIGDAIVMHFDAVYEVLHDTGKPLKASLVTDDLVNLEDLLRQLKKYKGHSSEESLSELQTKKADLLSLKKKAPRALKFEINIEIDDIKDLISDIRFDSSKEGQFLKVARKIQKTSMAELRRKGRYADIHLQRRENKFRFYIWGTLKKGESVDEMKKVFSKAKFKYPVEYEF